MSEIGAFDAKNRLSELLTRAERGEEITITRRGKPVAKLGPIPDAYSVEGARSAMARIRERAKSLKLSASEVEELIASRREGLE